MSSLGHLAPRAITLVVLLVACHAGRAQDAKPKPTGSISGHVLIDNKGASGIEVGVMSTEGSSRRVPIAHAKSDSEGYYHLDNLAAGNYQVVAFTPQMTSAETSADFGSPYGSAKNILLSEGENVTDIDVKLVRGGVITGRVTDAENKPVVETGISLEPVVDPGQRPPRLPAGYGLIYQTDDRGIYRIYGLAAGRYRVSVGSDRAQLIGSLTGFYQKTYHPDVTDPSRATIIELAEGGEAKDVDIKVSRHEDTLTISGRVTDADTGLPIAGARIEVLMPRSFTLDTGLQSDLNGKFTIEGVTAGRYGVYLGSESGNSDVYSDPIFVDVSDRNVSDVEIKAIHGLTITGSVLGDNIELKELLKQIPGLRVSANTVPAGGMTETTSRSFGSGTVAADGSFTITGLRPGRAMLSVSSPDFSKRPSVQKVSLGGVGLSQGFEIERGQAVSGIQVVVAYGSGLIRGTVTLQGAPLANYRVQIMCRREEARTYAGSATLDARGHFLIRQLAPGVYDCTMQYINLTGNQPNSRPPAPQHQQVNVVNGSEAELNFIVDLTPKGVSP